MNAKRNIIVWGALIVLLIILGFAITTPEFQPNDKLITLPFALPVLGDTINEFMAIALLSVIVIGAVIGALTLSLAASFLSFLRLSPDWQIGAQGAILILVLAVRQLFTRREASV